MLAFLEGSVLGIVKIFNIVTLFSKLKHLNLTMQNKNTKKIKFYFLSYVYINSCQSIRITSYIITALFNILL